MNEHSCRDTLQDNSSSACVILDLVHVYFIDPRSSAPALESPKYGEAGIHDVVAQSLLPGLYLGVVQGYVRLSRLSRLRGFLLKMARPFAQR